MAPNISVCMAVKNGGAYLFEQVSSILPQLAGEDELVISDDHSEDDTAAIVKRYADRNVKLISLKDYVTAPLNSYKKKAIETAISRASGTLIVTTDADCYLPKHWLET